MPDISIIIPIHNDLTNGFIKNQIDVFKRLKNAEVIYIDGGSTDGSIEFLTKSFVKVLSFPSSNRAQRINKGLKIASSDLILIHHPRSVLSEVGINHLIKNKNKYAWGGFTHQFDKKSTLLAFTSWYSNNVRAKIREIFYLDHCLFLNKKKLICYPLMPEIDIFEDTAYCEKLKKLEHSVLLPFPSTTSSIRFIKNGTLFQSLMNQVLKICWYMKISPKRMNQVYEKGLELNSKV